jgi:hypothetical protein
MSCEKKNAKVHKHLSANCWKSTVVRNLFESTEVGPEELNNRNNRVKMSELSRYAHIYQNFWVATTLQEYRKNYTFSEPLRTPALPADAISDVG